MIVATLLLSGSGFYAYLANAQDEAAATDAVDENIKVDLSLVESGKNLKTWSFGYRRASPIEALQFAPLSFTPYKVSAGDSLSLSAVVDAKVTAKDMQTLEGSIGAMATKPQSSLEAIQKNSKTVTLAKTGGTMTQTFDGILTGRSVICQGSIDLYAWASAKGKDIGGVERSGQDFVNAKMDPQCSSSGSVTVEMSLFPTTSIREGPDGERSVAYVPYRISG